MKHATSRGLYTYWNTVRGSRLAPRRYEIEPSQIVPYLSETIILEQPCSDACRIRVSGTKVCDLLGHELRGQLFYELWEDDDQAVLMDNLHTIATHGAVGLFRFNGWLVDDAPPAEFEMVLMPLTHLEERVERVLGSICLLRGPAWISTSLPSRVSLVSNAIVWPDGRPYGLAAKAQPSQFFAGEVPSVRPGRGVRRARLVRRERRSFLVYDGGLADNE